MSVLDPKAWMPDGMTQADKDALIAAHPDDPHRAAAEAWEAWAASLGTAGGDGTRGATSVSTGAQSVSYGDSYGGGDVGDALRRAAWHRSRAKPRSVEVGPQYGVEAHWWDDEDGGTIPTVDVGTVP